MKHRFNSTYADGSDATLVKPSNWNDTHVFGFRSLAVNGATVLTDDIILATAGAGGISISLPNPSTCTGQPFVFKKVDSAAGFVTINPFAAETIDGQSSYLLVNQYQYVELASDGTNWQVVNNN